MRRLFLVAALWGCTPQAALYPGMMVAGSIQRSAPSAPQRSPGISGDPTVDSYPPEVIEHCRPDWEAFLSSPYGSTTSSPEGRAYFLRPMMDRCQTGMRWEKQQAAEAAARAQKEQEQAARDRADVDREIERSEQKKRDEALTRERATLTAIESTRHDADTETAAEPSPPPESRKLTAAERKAIADKKAAAEAQRAAKKAEAEARERNKEEQLARIQVEICGPVPIRRAWNGIYQGLEDHFKQSAHDPDSVEFASCSDAVMGKACWVVKCAVRAKNAFGAKVLDAFTFAKSASGWETIRGRR